MGTMLDLLDDAFEEIFKDGSRILDEDFMMNIFRGIQDKFDMFKEYVQYMSKQKQSNPVGGCLEDNDKVLPFDLLRNTLFHPTQQDIRQTGDLFATLAE